MCYCAIFHAEYHTHLSKKHANTPLLPPPFPPSSLLPPLIIFLVTVCHRKFNARGDNITL